MAKFNITEVSGDLGLLRGKRFDFNEDLQKAFDGEITASLGKAHKHEHVNEGQYKEIVEMYTPIFGTDSDELLGVIELYKLPKNLLANFNKIRKLTWIMTLLGASLLAS